MAKVVQPTLSAGHLFQDHPMLTRLYTTLSPEDMTEDPVFSWNPSLPDVSRHHVGRMQQTCNCLVPGTYDGVFTTAQGFSYFVPGGKHTPARNTMPASLRIENLRETGVPEVVVDNTDLIRAAVGAPPDATKIGQCTDNPAAKGKEGTGWSCAMAPTASRSGAWLTLAGIALAASTIVLRRRR